MKSNITLFCLLFFTFSGFSQEPVLVTDYFAGSTSAFDEDNFKGMEVDSNTMIFPLTDSLMGKELGILQNGQLSFLKDLNDGLNSSNPGWFVKFNGSVYFAAIDDTNGGAIWKSDGTAAGTEIAIDVDSVNLTNRPQGLIVSKSNHLYFTFGRKLFRSDGTQAGTAQIANNVSFSVDRSHQSPNYCTYEEGVAYLTKDDSDTIEVYSATDTTSLLVKFAQRSPFGDIYGINEVKAGLFFTVDDSRDANNGTYSYDRQTKELLKFNFGGQFPSARRVLKFDDEKVIGEISGYYVFDGYDSGVEVLQISSPFAIAQTQKIEHLKIQDKMIFHSDEGGFGERIAITDGTNAGTSVIVTTENSYVSNMIAYGKYGFWASGVLNFYDPEFYYTDIESGTTERFFLWDNSTSTGERSVLLMGIQNNKLYFLSDKDRAVGREMYYIDLTFGDFSNTKENTETALIEVKKYGNGVKVISNKTEKMEIAVFDVLGRKIESFVSETNQFIEGERANQMLFYVFKIGNIQLSEKVFFGE